MLELLKSPIINKSAIAVLLWPYKPAQNAKVLFRNKLYYIQGNKFNQAEISQIKEIITKLMSLDGY